MKMVIDTNMLSSDKLRAYLEWPEKPLAVLCDSLGREMYQSKNPVSRIPADLAILADHPDQILVLKRAEAVWQLPHDCDMALEMVDEDHTRGFGVFVRQVRAEALSPGTYRKQLLELAAEAAKYHEEGLTQIAPNIEFGVNGLWDEFTSQEKRVLCSRGVLPVSASLGRKMNEQILDIASAAFEDKGLDLARVRPQDVPNTFLFRYTLACYIRSITQKIKGKLHGHAQMRNGIVDCGFVAYATYFDGLLTRDGGAQENYFVTMSFLKRFLGKPTG